MPEPAGRVLVTGRDTRSFLTVVRSLGRCGVRVEAAWCPPGVPSAHSRYLAAMHRIPEYRCNDREWLDALLALLRRERFDLVIPCDDASALPFQRHRAELEPAARFYLLEDSAFEVCFSKQKTHELARQLEVRVPRQRRVESAAELAGIAEEWGFPLVLKPPSSVSLARLGSKVYVTKVWNAAQMHAALRLPGMAAGFLVEENFIGFGAGVEVLCREGEILTAFQHERVHEPLLGGGSSYRKSVPLDAALLDATRRLMRALRYTGVAMAEFKVNRATGAWVLIEINGRFWGSLPLAVAAGIDFPRYLYEMLCRGRRSFPTAYRLNLYCRNWLLDLYWMRANMRADRSNPALMTVPPRQVWGELRNLLLLRERSDTFTLDDPMPAIRELVELAGDRAAVERLAPVRGLLRRKTLRRLREARTILFLCKGNICRSPFAERYFQTLRPAARCLSAGFYPSGRRSPEAALEAALQCGVDLAPHRSLTLTPQLAAEADVIVIFDREQRAMLRAHFPEHLAKACYLGALDPAGPLEVADPYGGDTAHFLETYKLIARLLDLP